ncbi:MAG: hypothetical protein M3Y81_22695 [Chloroflexota bacterium]|nr:hypothetical protein [Chloroflexota bacterium]
MGYSLLTIQKLSDQPKDASEYPIFSDGWQLTLTDNERIVWQGSASALSGLQMVNGTWRKVAQVRANTQVIITDKRLVYICRKYRKGGMWFGGLLAVFLTLAEMSIAVLVRYGKAAVGQVRYEFAQAILAKSVKLGPLTSNEVTVIGGDRNGTFMVTLDLPRSDYETVAATLARQITPFRGIAAPKVETKQENNTTQIYYTFPRGQDSQTSFKDGSSRISSREPK